MVLFGAQGFGALACGAIAEPVGIEAFSVAPVETAHHLTVDLPD